MTNTNMFEVKTDILTDGYPVYCVTTQCGDGGVVYASSYESAIELCALLNKAWICFAISDGNRVLK